MSEANKETGNAAPVEDAPKQARTPKEPLSETDAEKVVGGAVDFGRASREAAEWGAAVEALRRMPRLPET